MLRITSMGAGQSAAPPRRPIHNAVVGCHVVEALVDGKFATYKLVLSHRETHWIVLRRFSEIYELLGYIPPSLLS